MQDTLSSIYPSEILPILGVIGKVNWLNVYPYTENNQAHTGFKVNWELLQPAIMNAIKPAVPDNNKGFVLAFLDKLRREGGGLFFSYLEAGGVAVAEGPKLFTPTEEQFDSMTHVDLHMPVNEFRSPYPVLVVRIPNEWRKAKCKEFGCDINRAPLHVLVRYRYNLEEQPYVFGVLRYPEYENFYQFQHNPGLPDRTLEEIINFHLANNFDKNNPQYDGEVFYCREAFRAALNLCMLLTYIGHKTTGPIDPRIYKKNRKENSPRKFADFHGVQINQNIVIRKVENNLSLAQPQEGGEDLITTRLWEVKPHWRRGHWRRKPGWQQYIDAGQKPPLAFVRPCLVRRDRLIDGPAESQVTYKVQ